MTFGWSREPRTKIRVERNGRVFEKSWGPMREDVRTEGLKTDSRI